MKSQAAFGFAIALCAVNLNGCGGGGGSSSAAPATTGNSLAMQRAVASLRNTRNALALTGLGLKATTRAQTVRMGSRAALLLLALNHTRSVTSGYDADAQLYYTVTINADGSGRQNLFSDSAHQQPAGYFLWPAPQWHNGVVNSYPAIYHLTYSVTAGPFAGCSGTLDITLNDPAGRTGFLHLLNKDKQGETNDASLTVGLDSTAIDLAVQLAGGVICDETETMNPDGDVTGTAVFNDGYKESITVQPDGDGTETLDAPDGLQTATGDFASNGSDTVQLSDGSSDTVDVDTDNSDDSGDGGDSGDSGDIRARKTPAARKKG